MTRYIHQALARDRSLVLSIDESLRSYASEWMPSLTEEIAAQHPSGPSIRMDRGSNEVTRPAESPQLALGRVSAWIDSKRGTATLLSAEGDIGAVADLNTRVATVNVRDASHPAPADVTSLLTITAALLLARDGRSAMHAAAVVHPETRGAWLLCGDSHSGKSTTTANLIKGGWSYLSDDYVVLSRESDDAISVEGWPDDFHLDQGWHRGISTGTRDTYREADLPSGRRADAANLERVLFVRVSPDEPTAIAEIPAVVSLERLIRQSPWLIADAGSAPRVLSLLRDAASVDRGELRLGLDTYADPGKLSAIVTNFAARED